MGTALKESAKKKNRTAVPRGTLPRRMRMLYITTYHRTGAWLAEAFRADSAADISLEESLGVAAGLARLRDEIFDAVLVSHEPGELDALELIEGLRVGGSDDPIIVLGTQSEPEMSALSFEVGADAYVCVNTTTTRTLIWIVARAIERHQLIRENRRLAQAERHRLEQEHIEAERLLRQQRELLCDLESLRRRETAPDPNELAAPLAGPTEPPRCVEPALSLPESLVCHYRELLRTYVIMGSGNLGAELGALAELLATAGVTAQQTMLLHLEVLEELIRGLGNRSTRHVMTRADLLALEVIVHLGENYRLRYQERLSPARQKLLPGFDLPAPAAFQSA
jgi:DNA-binding response OmpR family regulator